MNKIILCLSLLTISNLFCIDLNDPIIQQSLNQGLLTHKNAFRQLMNDKYNNIDIRERARNLLDEIDYNYNLAKTYNIKIARDYGSMAGRLQRESQQ